MVATSILVGMMVGQMVIGAYGKYKAGKAAKKAGQAGADIATSQAELSDYNADVAKLQAQDALERGAESESKFRAGVRGLVASQRTGFAAGNIDVAGGSAMDVQADAAFLGELDALTIRTNAAREAWGYQVQEEDLHRQAAIARKGGQMALAEGQSRANQEYLAAAGTIVGGATSLMGQRYGMGGTAGRAGSNVVSARNYSRAPLSGPVSVNG
jgi:hypothetical protein